MHRSFRTLLNDSSANGNRLFIWIFKHIQYSAFNSSMLILFIHNKDKKGTNKRDVCRQQRSVAITYDKISHLYDNFFHWYWYKERQCQYNCTVRKKKKNPNVISKTHRTKQNNSKRLSIFIYFKCLFCYLKHNSSIIIFQFSSVDVTKKGDKKSKSRIVSSGLVVKLSNPKHDNFPRR